MMYWEIVQCLVTGFLWQTHCTQGSLLAVSQGGAGGGGVGVGGCRHQAASPEGLY